MIYWLSNTSIIKAVFFDHQPGYILFLEVRKKPFDWESKELQKHQLSRKFERIVVFFVRGTILKGSQKH